MAEATAATMATTSGGNSVGNDRDGDGTQGGDGGKAAVATATGRPDSGVGRTGEAVTDDGDSGADSVTLAAE
jgi:hypothetical protein